MRGSSARPEEKSVMGDWLSMAAAVWRVVVGVGVAGEEGEAMVDAEAVVGGGRAAGLRT
jgi:hypothetical protein